METKRTLLSRLLADGRVRYCLCFLLLLPLLLRRDLTSGNELKYLEIVDEALSDGHFWCLYLDGAAYADKPPLYFWLLMACRRLLGFHSAPLLVFLFSMLPAFGVLAIFDRWSSGLGLRWRIVAEAALLTTAYFLGGALVLRMDMLMTFFITLAMWLFWQIDRGGRSPGLQAAFALAVFLAIFTKGPVGFIFPLAGTLAFLASERRMRDFRRAWGWRTWLILLALCAIWWGGAYLEGGRAYIDNLLVHQTFGRAVNSFHHAKPWYYYLYTIWYAMGPWALLTIPVAVWGAVRRVGMSSSVRFSLVASAAFFLIMTAFSGKLQIYLLPMFGFVNMAAFHILRAADDGTRRWPHRVWTGACIVAAIMLLACTAAGFFFPDIFQ